MNQSFSKSIKIESKPDKFCPGCGHSIALKLLGYTIDDLSLANKVFLGVDIGCSLLAWDYFNFKTIQTHHGRTVPVISGYKKINKNDIGIAYVGDGGAYAIGLQSLIHAANRNDAITVFVINNTLYGMTGGQMAPTTIKDEITTTTPEGKDLLEKGNPIDGVKLLKSLNNEKAYIQRVVITNPVLVKNIFKKAIENQINNNSFSFVEILSFCPTNWKKNAKESIDFLENKIQKNFNLNI